MARRYEVIRERGRVRGLVPVGMDLWTRRGPVLDDRLLFHDRPRPHRGAGQVEGEVSGHGKYWVLQDACVDETWAGDGEVFRRFRAAVVDPDTGLSWGNLYWVRRRPQRRGR